MINGKWLLYGLLSAVAVAFLIAIFVMIYRTPEEGSALWEGSTDIYPTWQGAKLFWEDGISPYDELVGLKSQQVIYGKAVGETQDQFQYVYPFYSIFHIGPLAFVDFHLAASIYMEALIIGLLVAMALVANSLRWLPKPTSLAIIILWTVISYFSARGLLLGQPTIVAYVCHTLTIWALLKHYDRAAGILLSISTIKPQTGFLLVPILLFWAWRVRRQQFVYAFIGSFGFLMGISFLLEPTWLGDWLERLSNYSEYNQVTVPATYLIAHAWGILPESIANGLYILLALGLVAFLAHFWLNQKTDWLWGIYLTMTVTLLIAPRVATTSYVELFPILYITAFILEKKQQYWMIIFGGVVILIGYWALHIATVPSVEETGTAGLEAPMVYIAFPVMILVLMLYYRGQWKFERIESNV